jgi:hypothetical protein
VDKAPKLKMKNPMKSMGNASRMSQTDINRVNADEKTKETKMIIK